VVGSGAVGEDGDCEEEEVIFFGFWSLGWRVMCGGGGLVLNAGTLDRLAVGRNSVEKKKRCGFGVSLVMWKGKGRFEISDLEDHLP
jgi:hypothetical protein